jgi:hypothetical protein
MASSPELNYGCRGPKGDAGLPHPASHPELQGTEDDALQLSKNMQLTCSAGKAG